MAKKKYEDYLKELQEKSKKLEYKPQVYTHSLEKKAVLPIKKVKDVNTINDIYNFANNNQKSYSELSNEYQQSIKETRKKLTNITNKAKKNNIAIETQNDSLKPTLGSVTRKDMLKPIYLRNVKTAPNSGFNSVEKAYSGKSKNQSGELEKQEAKFDKFIANTEDYKDYKTRIDKTNELLRYSRDVAKVNEKGVSTFDKITVPFVSGFDNILNSTRNSIKDENGNRVVLPTISDIKSNKAYQDSDSKLYKAYSNITQSVGNMAPGIIANAILPGAGSVVFGTNTFNETRNQALLNGYNEKDASKYAIVNAGLELGIGKALGGTSSLLGKSPVSKMISNGFTNKFMSNPTISSMMSDMISEFGEEYVQEWLDPKVRSYILEHKDVAESWESSKFLSKENFYAGLMGAISAGLTNTPNAMRNQSNLNNQIDSIVTNIENNTETKLSKEEKQSIRKSFYDEYNKAIKTNTEINYDNITQNTGLPVTNKPILTGLNTNNQYSMQDMTMNNNNTYQYIKSDNSKIDNLRRSASEQKFNNSEQTTNFINMLEKIVSDKDIDIVFDSTLSNNVNGKYEKGIITINPNSSRAGEFIAVHELTHAIGTDSMRKIVDNYRKSNPQFESALQSILKNYNTTELTDEAMADVAGQLFGNQEFINNLSLTNPSLFKRIYNEIKYLWHQFTGYKNQNQFIEDLQYKWEQAYRSSNEFNGISNYSYETLKDGTSYVKLEDNLFTNNDGTPMTQKNIYNSLIGKTITFNDGITATIKAWLPDNKNMYNELFKRYPKYNNVSDIKTINKRINENMVELLEKSNGKSYNEPDYNNRHSQNKISTFDTRTISLFDGKSAYNLDLSIARMNDGTYVAYAKRNLSENTQLSNKIKKEAPMSKSQGVLPYANKVPQNKQNVNDTTKYSIQETQNNTQELDNSSFSFENLPKVKDGYTRLYRGLNNEYDPNYDRTILDSPNGYDTLTDSYELAKKYGDKVYYIDVPTEQIGNSVIDENPNSENYGDRYLAYKDDKPASLDGAKGSEYLLYTDHDNFDSNNYKKIESNSPKSVDNQGRKLSKQQQEYFKDTKERDADGSLKEMYHGTKNYGFTVFDRKYAKSSGNFGTGIYFAPTQDYSNAYGEMYKVYLNIKNPVDAINKQRTLTNEQVKKLVEAVANNEDYGIENYGYNATVESVTNDLIQHNNDFEIFQDLDITCVGDFVKLVELSNEVLGTNFDGIRTPLESIVFNSNQIKDVDNTNPTSDEDIRYSKNNATWQEYLEDNFEASGTRTNMKDIKLPIKKSKVPLPKDPTKESSYVYDEENKTAQLLDKRPERAKTTLKDSTYKTIRELVDKGEAINRLAKKTGNKELYAKYDHMGTAEAEGQYAISTAQTDNHGNRIGKSIMEIWEPIEKVGLVEEFSNYLLHKHNIARWEQGKPVFGDDVTSDISKNFVEESEKTYPQFKKWSKDINTYNKNQMQNMVDAGLTSQESQEYLNNTYDSYVRIYRDVKGQSPITQFKGNLKVNVPIKKAKGGNQDILPLKDSMAQQTIEIKKAIRRNEFGLELLNVLNNGENVEYDGKQQVVKNDDGTYSFTIFKNGQPIKMEIDEGIYEALEPKKSYNFEKTLPFKGIQKISQIQRGLLTDKNPLFIATNFFKDIGDAPFNSKYASKFAKNYVVAAKEMLNNGELWNKYRALGGEQNTYFDYKDGVKTPSDSKISKFVKKIQSINQVVEQLPRFTEFISTLEAGGTEAQAMYNAAEVTTNFKRGGETAKALNRNGANFLNASIQGFDKQIRNFTGQNGAKGYINLLVKATILGVLPSVLNHLLLEDDEDYKDLPDYIKDSYYLFKTSDNNFIRIPKGRVMSTFGMTARRTLEYRDGEKDAYKGIIQQIGNQVAPNNPLEDNIFAPIIGIKNNRSWNGSEIVPQRLQNELSENQYDEKTDSISKSLGKIFKISPKKINYILDQYTGGIGDVVLPVLTPEARQNPISAKFSTNSIMNNKYTSDFYETKEKLTQKSNSTTATTEDILKSKYINSVSSQLNELYKQKREIQNSDLNNKEKLEQVKIVQQQINDIAKFALEDYENIFIENNYSCIGDKEFYKNSNDEWVKVTNEQRNKQLEISSKYDITPSEYYLKRDEYNYAYSNPTKYSVITQIADYNKYNEYKDKIKEIRDNTSEDKTETIKYIDSLKGLSIPQKAMLIRMYYPSFDNYNEQIIDYIKKNVSENKKREDIFKGLGFTIKNGRVYY